MAKEKRSWMLLAGILLAPLVSIVVLQMFSRSWIGETYSHYWVDWWTLSHFGHGIVFCVISKVIWPNASVLHLLLITVWVESAWEIFENTQAVINCFGDIGSVPYRGDSIVNSLTDQISCFFGALLTAIGAKKCDGIL